MEFKIIIGPANSGKSQKLCDDMVKAAGNAPGEEFIAIVPEQFTLQMQRRVVASSKNHAVMNIDVVSFNRLAMKVFSQLGISLNEILDDTGKSLVLRSVLEECRNDLTLYRSKVKMEGFIEEIKSVLTELKTYGVSQEALSAFAGNGNEEESILCKKMQDIALIYGKYNEKIKDTYTTSEEVPDVFVKAIPHSEKLKGAHIYLDGFTGFTPVQYKIIEGFMGVCRSLTCTVTAPRSRIRGNCPDSDLFKMANVTCEKLIDTASLAGVKCDIIYHETDEASAGINLTNGPEGNRAEVYEYPLKNAKAEAESVAGEILRLVRDEGLRYREIAVVCSDMDTYFPHLDKALKSADIPAFIDYKSRIRDNRFAKFVLSAMRIVNERFSFDSVFSFLRCGLTDITLDECDLLENYCLEFGIKGTVVWSREFKKNRHIKKDVLAWDLDVINALREKFMACISPFAAAARRSRTAADFKAAFDKLFESCQVEQRLENISKELEEKGEESLSQEYSQVFGYIGDLLLKAEILTAGNAVSAEEYFKILKNGIAEIKIGLVPPTLDMVTCGDIQRSRLNKLKALFVVGVNEGKLPSLSSGGGILSQRERKLLRERDIDLAPLALEDFYAQRYYIYLMLNKPKNRLYLTWAATDGSGAELRPSPIIDELDEFIPAADERVQVVNGSSQPESLLSGAASQIRKFAISGDENTLNLAQLKAVQNKNEGEIERLVNAAFISNNESPLDGEIAKALFGDPIKGSVSRFEKFNECAFKHFLSYGLHIDNRPEYEIKATSLGSIYHAALEKYVNEIRAKGLDLRSISDEASRSIAAEAAQEALSEEESGVFESSARARYQAQRTVDVIVKTTDVIRAELKEGRYDIGDVERRFTTRMEDGSIFGGIIDRIDIYDNGKDIYVKIIDYKTGSKAFSLREMDEGVQLQLPVYLSAALESLQGEYPGRGVRPSGIYYFLVKDDFEKEGKKDSQIKGLEEEEGRMQAVMDFARGKLLETGEKMRSGDVSIHPLKDGDTIKACQWCDFKGVCRFKEGKLSGTVREVPYLDKEELEENVYGGNHMD